MRRTLTTFALSLAAVTSACGDRGAGLDHRRDAIVYGTDDRLDYFDVSDPQDRALVAASMVALVPSAVLQSTAGDLARAPTWGEVDGLCSGEPFADQPAAAFCSGVLVDWDLVLTAGHCTRAYGISDFKAVFGYYYAEPGRLAVAAEDVISIARIVAEELDPEGVEPRLDYAWLRLSRPVAPPRRPVSIYVGPPPLTVGDPVIAVGAGGGVPMKWDADGQVQDARTDWSDYFIADSDNSGGSSGGGAFDSQRVLTGIIARGGTDFMPSPSGCLTTVREPDGSNAMEQFTYAFRAVSGLCDKDPSASSICRAACGNPCQALPPPSGGCSLAPTPGSPDLVVIVFLLLLAAVNRRARSTAASPP